MCVHVRGGLEDYKEEVNGKYTLSDKIRGRHSFAAPPLLLPAPSFSALAPLWQGPGKIKQVVWAWQESWLGPGWPGLQAAGGYQKLLDPALGQHSEWPGLHYHVNSGNCPGPPVTPVSCPYGVRLATRETPPLPMLLLHSSTPDIKGGQGGEGGRGPETPSQPQPFSWGGRTTQSSPGHSLGTPDNTAALEGTTASWLSVDLPIELAFKTHSEAVNLASEPEL
ncbi:unnamed protein product [Pleuronectes platessa]|uniref:Uncharacterized protein n=1 Tax=Pleuronectes platessa TaxID=8262 RepID=A0A9N7YY33_PLEPL|nr:unnamed protein product [Pleuronectes platessa]